MDQFISGGFFQKVFVSEIFKNLTGTDNDILLLSSIGVSDIAIQNDKNGLNMTYNYTDYYVDRYEFGEITSLKIKSQYLTPHIYIDGNVSPNVRLIYAKIRPDYYRVYVENADTNYRLVLLEPFHQNWILKSGTDNNLENCAELRLTQIPNNFECMDKTTGVSNVIDVLIGEFQKSKKTSVIFNSWSLNNSTQKYYDLYFSQSSLIYVLFFIQMFLFFIASLIFMC